MWLLALLGCGRATTPPAIANATAPVRRTATLQDTWPALVDDGRVVAATPVGPFAVGLVDVCGKLGHDLDTCGVLLARSDENGGPFVAVAQLRIWDGPDEEAVSRRLDLLVRGPAGWYILPRFARLAAGKSRLDFTGTDLHGDVLVVHYEVMQPSPTGGWLDAEIGLVACKPVDNTIACTPKILTRRDLLRGSGRSTMALACRTIVEADTITIVPLDTYVEGYEATWTKEAAAACKRLPYAGRHAVTF